MDRSYSAYKRIYFPLFIISFYQNPSLCMSPSAALSAVSGFFNPSAPENDRTVIGALLRATLKKINATEMDLERAGLKSEEEKRITLGIFKKMRESPQDPALRRQFTERQLAVTSIAFNLIDELRKFNADPSESTVSETLGSIKISMELRRLHTHHTLAPLIATQLLQETNKARNNIERTLRVRLDNANSILQIEPPLNEETVSIAKKMLKERGAQIFGNNEEEETRLMEYAQELYEKKHPPSNKQGD